jgi:hypothetical protein
MGAIKGPLHNLKEDNSAESKYRLIVNHLSTPLLCIFL